MSASKVGFITGAGRGVGAEVARAASQAGHRLVDTGGSLERSGEVRTGVACDRIAFVQLDVTSEAQANAAVEAALTQFSRIGALVNNAGYSLFGDFEEMTSTAIERNFAANIFGPMNLMRAGPLGHAQPAIRPHSGGPVQNNRRHFPTGLARRHLTLETTENSSPARQADTLVGPSEPDLVMLAALIRAHSRYDGCFELRIPGVYAIRRSRVSTELAHPTPRPVLCIVAQRSQSVMLGQIDARSP